MVSRARARVLLLVAVAMSGCASVQVRSVGTNVPGVVAFDLAGPSLAALGTEAQRLCPQGYAVMRQWQRSNAAVGGGDPTTDWLLATAALSYDQQPAQAQLSIACKS